VGFVGFNIGAVNVGIGFGNIGWVPLAPFEAFHPWWGPRATIVNNNVHFRNLMVNNAMTSVTRENFQAGRFGSPYIASQQELRSIHTVPMQGALPIVPSQANLRFTQRAAAPSLAVRPALMNRPFAGRPAVAFARTPFSEQQASVSRATRVAFGSESSNAPAFSRSAGAAVPAYARTAGAAANSNDPWQRFSANRNANGTSGAPAYARPAGATAPIVTYGRPAAPAYAQPQYDRQATPAYSRPAAPAYSRLEAPAYNRPSTGYSRPATSYSRAASSYSRPAAPRPAAAARPTHSNDDHRDR
jgi:hypothetical protein